MQRFVTHSILLLVSFVSSSFASAAPDNSWYADPTPAAAVVVQSTYQTDQGKSQTVQGRGVYLVEGDGHNFRVGEGRHFVLTVAHVAAGESVSIKIGDEVARIRSKLVWARQDLAFFEIEKPTTSVLPLAVWNVEMHSFVNAFTRSHENLKSELTRQLIQPFYIASSVMDSRGGQGPFIALPLDYKNPLARAFDLSSENLILRTIFETLSGNLFVKAKIAPGMSGAPAFISDDGVVAVLAGLASQYSRFETHSFLTSYDALTRMVALYDKGQRGDIVERLWNTDVVIRWKHDGRTTYRILVDAKTGVEIVRELRRSDLNGDAQEGTNGDGQEGTNGDGQEGTNGDGGSSNRARPLTPGLVMSGQPMRVIHLTRVKKNEELYVQANWAALDLLMRMPKDVQMEGLSRPDFFALFKKRATHLQDKKSLNESTTISHDGDKDAVTFVRSANGRPDTIQLPIVPTTFNQFNLMIRAIGSDHLYRVAVEDVAVLNLERVPNPKAKASPEDLWQAALAADRELSVDIDQAGRP